MTGAAGVAREAAVRPVVALDVDGVVLGAAGQLRPGVRLLVDVLDALGYDVHLWSKAGAPHACDAAWRLGLDGLAAHAKPGRPVPLTDTFGALPALVVDNDARHLAFVPDGVPTLLVESWWG